MSEGIIADEIDIRIHDERNRQNEKWGDQSQNTLSVWSAILTEEVGEVAKAVLEIRAAVFERRYPVGELLELKTELVQVLAVGHAWLEHLDNGIVNIFEKENVDK